MAFYEHRLPTDIERRTLGGPQFSTSVLFTESGFEKRNINWSKIRGRWDISSALMYENKPSGETRTDVEAIRSLFAAQEGRAHGFRFKDFGDFNIGDFANPTTDNQSIGTGDTVETVFQVFKTYTFGAITYDRNPITRIVSGAVAVLLDDVVKSDPGDYSIDLDTGLITFTSPPGGSVDVQVALEYDNPVRFDIDHLEISEELASLGAIPSIPLVELRGE